MKGIIEEVLKLIVRLAGRRIDRTLNETGYIEIDNFLEMTSIEGAAVYIRTWRKEDIYRGTGAPVASWTGEVPMTPVANKLRTDKNKVINSLAGKNVAFKFVCKIPADVTDEDEAKNECYGALLKSDYVITGGGTEPKILKSGTNEIVEDKSALWEIWFLDPRYPTYKYHRNLLEINHGI